MYSLNVSIDLLLESKNIKVQVIDSCQRVFFAFGRIVKFLFFGLFVLADVGQFDHFSLAFGFGLGLAFAGLLVVESVFV